MASCNDITVYLDQNGEASITAEMIDGGSIDTCGIVTRTLSDSSFSCEDIGDNPVTLTVTDPSGNEGSCTSTVTVLDNISPIVKL